MSFEGNHSHSSSSSTMKLLTWAGSTLRWLGELEEVNKNAKEFFIEERGGEEDGRVVEEHKGKIEEVVGRRGPALP